MKNAQLTTLRKPASASVPTENDTDRTNTSLDADWFEKNNSKMDATSD